MPAIRWLGSLRSAASSDDPGQRPVAAGIGGERQLHQRLDPPRLRADCATTAPTATRLHRRFARPPARTTCPAPRVGEPVCQAGHLRVGECRPLTTPRPQPLRPRRRRGRPSASLRSSRRESRRARPINRCSAARADGIVDRDDVLQVSAARVEPAAVQHAATVIGDADGSSTAPPAAAVDAVPPPSVGHPVDDVTAHSSMPARRSASPAARVAVLVVAHRADGALGVDDDRDGRVGTAAAATSASVDRGRRSGPPTDRRAARLPFRRVDGHQHQRLLGHEAEHRGQGGDQRAGPIEMEIRSMRWSWRDGGD